MPQTNVEDGLKPETRVVLTRLRGGVVSSGEMIMAGFEQVGSCIHELREAGFLIRTKRAAGGTLYFLAAEPVGLGAGGSSQGPHPGAESDGEVAPRPVQGQERGRRGGRLIPVGLADSLFDTRDFEVEPA